jgi:hypothetical protein
VFPSAGEANQALRALAGIIQKHRSRRTASRQTVNQGIHPNAQKVGDG